MSKKEETGLESMELSLGAKIVQPLAIGVLLILNRAESEKEYFDISIQKGDGARTEKIKLFFYAAFSDRSKWYLPPFLLILLILISDMGGVVSAGVDKQAYGLAIDIFGAVIVASGLFRGITGIARDTDSTSHGHIYGGLTTLNTASLSAEARKTVDGVYGIFYLFIGFTLQLLAVSNII